MSTDHIDQVWSKSEDPLQCDMNHWDPEYLLRNKATKLVKRDQIQGVIARLRKNPGSKTAWNEAQVYLGSKQNSTLPESWITQFLWINC